MAIRDDAIDPDGSESRVASCPAESSDPAAIPHWLAETIHESVTGPTKAPPTPADPAMLATELIRRFPVSGRIDRNGQMTRGIGSLIGRGDPPDVVAEAIRLWHLDFVDRIGIPIERATTDAAKVIAFTLANSKFQPRDSERHLQTEISDELHENLSLKLLVGSDHQDNTKALGIWSSLCLVFSSFFHAIHVEGNTGQASTLLALAGAIQNANEFAFVEAVLLHTFHKIQIGEFAEAGIVRMTDAQVQAIARIRHPEVKWEKPQVERLKRRFIDRPNDGKPATRFALLTEVRKGHRIIGERSGVPSEYRVAPELLELLGG